MAHEQGGSRIATAPPGSAENIFLFIPNLIGFGRILLALLAFYWMPTDYSRAFWCYMLSAFLDAWDGHAARYFNQSTKFGAMLDQLTDRCGTMCLLVCLSVFYPKYMFWFQISMAIDIASHWLHTQVSEPTGENARVGISLHDTSRVSNSQFRQK